MRRIAMLVGIWTVLLPASMAFFNGIQFRLVAAQAETPTYYNNNIAIKHGVGNDGNMPNQVFSEKVLEVSLVKLLSNPNLYHGKAIRTYGYLTIGLENNAIYLSRDDANYLITKNGLWIDINNIEWDSKGVNPKDFNKKFVVIEGVFDKDLLGHGGAFSGGFSSIWRSHLLKQVRAEKGSGAFLEGWATCKACPDASPLTSELDFLSSTRLGFKC